MSRILRTVIAGAAVAMALSLIPRPAHAQVYKCKDSAGKTTYSGQPCEYGGQPLPLPDNTVQAERPPPSAYGASSSYGGASGVSAECAQAQRALQEQTSKPTPRGIVDANRQRQGNSQMSKQVEVACAGGSSSGGSQSTAYGKRETGVDGDPSAGRRPSGNTAAAGGSAECAQMQRELQEQLGKPAPAGIADANRQSQNVSQLSRQYEVMCGGGGTDGQRSPPKPKREAVTGFNPYAGQPSTLCPDGSYVRGASCQLCPDGSFVTGGSGCQLTPNGKFVQGGKPATICPDGSHVAGRCRLGPDGKYYGE